MNEEKNIVITGGSRGIGAAIARELARRYGANANIALFVRRPHSNRLVAEEVEALGGKAFPFKVDVGERGEVNVAVEEFVKNVDGEIHAVINCASQIFYKDVTEKQINVMKRTILLGTHNVTEACLPHMSHGSHVINIAPSYPMAQHWIEEYGAYAMLKSYVGLDTSLLVCMHPDIILSTLWPKYMIYTDATVRLFGDEEARKITRSSQVMADAVALILESRESGRCWLDETTLQELGGVTDFSKYLLPGAKAEDLMLDIFVDKK